jgi:quercetin dioxygenase-like cupin family protein
MAIPHASSGEIIDIRPIGEGLSQAITTTLIKTDRIEVIRLVLPAGKVIAEHRARGEITVQCLEGAVEFRAHGRSQVLRAGQMLYLAAGEPHAVEAVEDASVLLTLQLEAPGAGMESRST